jgi:transcriptional regulator with XRE-family HTH domain
MQAAETKVQFYKSGFPKEMTRNKYNLKINERLKAARKRKKLSAMAVVEGLKKEGVSIGHSTLQGYEAAESNLNHRYPSLPVLMRLAEFYDCSLDYLFGVTDRFKPVNINPKEVEILDLLESAATITFRGKKINKTRKKLIAKKLSEILDEK